METGDVVYVGPHDGTSKIVLAIQLAWVDLSNLHYHCQCVCGMHVPEWFIF